MQPRDCTGQNGKIAKRTFGTLNGKKTCQQFIRKQNYPLQFTHNLATQGKQKVSFRHRQWYIAESNKRLQSNLGANY